MHLVLECQVCLSECKEDDLVSCQCLYKACKNCYTTYGIPSCMKCNVHFTKQFSQKHQIVHVFKSFHQKLTWEREFSLLASTQPFLEWEDCVTKLKKRLRFGERVVFPEKPKLFLSTSSNNPIFPCPASDCRGFVSGSYCGTCKREVCKKCREFTILIQDQSKTQTTEEPQKNYLNINTKQSIYNVSNQNKLKKHECNQQILASIQSIDQESKSCPRCRALIFKIEGCNHMFCTNCRTHFDWVSGRVLTSSSNHHYDSTTLFSKNVALFKHSNSENTEQCTTDPFTDAIPNSVITSIQSTTQGDKVYRALWKETISSRYLLRKRLNSFETELQYQEGLLRIRLMYLRKQLTENQAKSRILQEDEKHEKIFRQRTLLEMYLNACNDLQRMVYVNQSTSQIDEALRIYKILIDTCQLASSDTRNELGGQCLEFSCDFNSQLPHVTL
jgi:hypothetical protein